MDDGSDHGTERDTEFAREALPWLDDVYRFAVSLTRESADAEDVVQETFLRAYHSWRTFQSGTDCRRWLFTICRNVFRRERSRGERQIPLEESDLEALAAVRFHASLARAGDDRMLERLDLVPAVQAALDQLDEPFRSTVILVDLGDHAYDEAAGILGVPIGTVRSRLFRGRRMLQELLLDAARDAGLAASPQPETEAP